MAIIDHTDKIMVGFGYQTILNLKCAEFLDTK